MKKLIVFSAVFFMVIGIHAASHAQNAQDDFLVGLKLGASIPTGDMGEDFDTSFMYGIYGEVAYSPKFAFEGTLSRRKFSESDEGVGTLFPIHLQMSMFPDVEEEHFGGEKSLTMNELTLNGKVYLLAEGIRPYLTFGVGGYFWKFDIENLGDHTESDFGVNGGGGLLLPVGERVHLGVDARYTHVWTQIAADEQSLKFWNIVGLIAYGF